MNKCRAWAVVLLLLVADAMFGSEVSIGLRVRGGAVLQPKHSIELECVDGEKLLSLSITPDSVISVPGKTRQLTCTVADPLYWSAPVTLAVDEAVSTSTLIELWPPSQVTGRIVEPKDGPAAELLVWVSGPAGRGIEALGVRSCSVQEDRTFACPVPSAQALDLKLRLKGHISHFLWGIDSTATVSLGDLRFFPGASVVGRVTAEGECNVLKPPTVRVIPLASGTVDTRQQEGQLKRASSAAADARGFFHVDDVEPGTYTIEAEEPGCGLARMSPVTIYPDAETELRSDLVLTKPSDLEIRIDPKSDCFGRPWKVALYHITTLSGFERLVEERPADESGGVRIGGLPRGPYRVVVLDSSGSAWYSGPANVTLGLERVEIFLDFIRVTGTVLMGKKGIEADLAFGGRHGSVSINTVSDSSGRFDAALPREGRWRVDVRGIDVPLRQSLPEVEVTDGADLTLKLGDRAVKGRVVDEHDQPFSGAAVSVEEVEDRGELSQILSDADGRFVLAGFTRGRVFVKAEHSTLSSEEIEVDLSAEDADVELILKDRGFVELLVLRQGRPVPGAVAHHLAATATGLALRSFTAGLDGTIQVPLRPGDDGGAAVVIAAGAPARLVRIDRGSSQTVVSLDGIGGTLTVRTSTYPFLRSQGAVFPLGMFQSWSTLIGVERVGDLLTFGPMASGYYEACSTYWPNATCTGAALQDGVRINLE